MGREWEIVWDEESGEVWEFVMKRCWDGEEVRRFKLCPRGD